MLGFGSLLGHHVGSAQVFCDQFGGTGRETLSQAEVSEKNEQVKPFAQHVLREVQARV